MCALHHHRSKRLMLDPDDLINYELCFPGAATGEAEINCPHCSELVTVPVDDPMGDQSYQCSKCGGAFDVVWGEWL
jgi:DNA-directed RNA polymerase subunit RPC12/RpoP